MKIIKYSALVMSVMIGCHINAMEQDNDVKFEVLQALQTHRLKLDQLGFSDPLELHAFITNPSLRVFRDGEIDDEATKEKIQVYMAEKAPKCTSRDLARLISDIYNQNRFADQKHRLDKPPLQDLDNPMATHDSQPGYTGRNYEREELPDKPITSSKKDASTKAEIAPDDLLGDYLNRLPEKFKLDKISEVTTYIEEYNNAPYRRDIQPPVLHPWGADLYDLIASPEHRIYDESGCINIKGSTEMIKAKMKETSPYMSGRNSQTLRILIPPILADRVAREEYFDLIVDPTNRIYDEFGNLNFIATRDAILAKFENSKDDTILVKRNREHQDEYDDLPSFRWMPNLHEIISEILADRLVCEERAAARAEERATARVQVVSNQDPKSDQKSWFTTKALKYVGGATFVAIILYLLNSNRKNPHQQASQKVS